MVHTIRQVCPKTLSSARIASNITHVILTRVGLRLRLVIRVATLCVVWFDSILHCWDCIIRLLSFLLNNDTCHNLVASSPTEFTLIPRLFLLLGLQSFLKYVKTEVGETEENYFCVYRGGRGLKQPGEILPCSIRARVGDQDVPKVTAHCSRWTNTHFLGFPPPSVYVGRHWCHSCDEISPGLSPFSWNTPYNLTLTQELQRQAPTLGLITNSILPENSCSTS